VLDDRTSTAYPSRASWKGIANAKQAGKYRGRQSTMTDVQVQAIRDRVAAGENKSALGREFGVTRQTIYNIGNG
jgi:DNA invertase Pin-like site-specific DNA recombinase